MASPTAMTRLTRRGLLAAGAALAGAWSAKELLASPAGSEAVALPDYRQAGDPDDGPAFMRALGTGRPLFLPAGGGSGAGGAYVTGQIELAAGARIHGEGDGTIIRPRDRVARHVFHAESEGPDEALAGIELKGFRVEGRLPGARFHEFWNLIELAGVEDVLIEDVTFHGFVSDAILFAGESNGVARPILPRHNRRIIVRDCRFDGIDRDNRNAISIIDGSQVLIESCTFQDCSRPDMPGAIDIEPNAFAFYRVRDITIRNCGFVRCGGSNGAISIYIPAAVAAVPTGFRLIGNRFDSNIAADIFIHLNRHWEADDPDCDIRIDGNRGTGGRAPWLVFSAKGVVIGANNVWTDYAGSAVLGYTQREAHVRGFADSATYVRVGGGGPPAPFGIAVFNATDARFSGTFVDCGDGSADAAAIAFINDAARGIEVANARVSTPGRRTRHAVRSFLGLPPGQARQTGNDFGGLPSDLGQRP